MPELVILEDRSAIEAFLRRDTWRHVFEIGDLDERYWPQTRWYGWETDGALIQVALLYQHPSQPVLIFYGDPPFSEARRFAEALLPVLPRRMYAHLGSEVSDVLRERYRVTDLGRCLQMYLLDPAALPSDEDDDSVTLSSGDAAELTAFYASEHSSTAFDPAMLSTERYRAIRRHGRLASVAGLHVYSRAYSVAALGGVATSAAHRREGLASRTSAALCRSLLRDAIANVALDVMTDNTGAIAMYEKLGFAPGLVFQTALLEAQD